MFRYYFKNKQWYLKPKTVLGCRTTALQPAPSSRTTGLTRSFNLKS